MRNRTLAIILAGIMSFNMVMPVTADSIPEGSAENTETIEESTEEYNQENILAEVVNPDEITVEELSSISENNVAGIESETDSEVVEELGEAIDWSEKYAYINEVSLSLRGDISLNFYFDFSEFDESEKTRAYVDINGMMNHLNEPEEVEGKGFEFTYSISAKDMDKELSLSVYDGDGKIAHLKRASDKGVDGATEYENGVFKYSVRDYLNAVSASSQKSDSLKRLAFCLDSYGQYAQYYFDYNTEEVTPVNPCGEVSLGELEQYKKQDNYELPEGISYYGSSLLLKDTITVRHYFKLDEGKDIENYSFVWDGFDMWPEMKGNLYYVDKEDIRVAELQSNTTLVIKDKDNNEYPIEYCPLSYVYDALSSENASDSLKQLCTSLYWYNKAAAEYFGVIKYNETMPEDPTISHKDDDDDDDDDDGPVQPCSEPIKEKVETLLMIDSEGESVFANSFDRAAGYSVADNVVVDEFFSDEDRWRTKFPAAYRLTYKLMEDFYSLQLRALKEVDCEKYAMYRLPNNKVIAVYNTDNSISGIYTYYGQTYGNGDNRRKDHGTCFWGFRSENETSITYTMEVYAGLWSSDKPHGKMTDVMVTGSYYKFVCEKQRESGIATINGTLYDFPQISYGNFCRELYVRNDIVVYVYTENFDYGPSTYEHQYNIGSYFNSNGLLCVNRPDLGLVVSSSNEKATCQNHSNDKDDYIEIEANTSYTIMDLADNKSDSAQAKRYGLNSNYLSGERNNLRIDKETIYDTLSRALKVATSETINYDDYELLKKRVDELSISFAQYRWCACKLADSENSIGIFRDYGSDDFYIYYGKMSRYTIDKERTLYNFMDGAGKLIHAYREEKTEEDTGYTYTITTIEVSKGNWTLNEIKKSPCRESVANGAFTTDKYTTIYSSSKLIDIHDTYIGNVDNWVYNGTVNWTRVKTVKDLSGTVTDTTYTYNPVFKSGKLQADAVDSEGYGYVDCVEDDYAPERILSTRVYGISGCQYATSIETDIVLSDDTVEESSITDDTTAIGNNYSDSDVHGSDTSKQYADSLMALASNILEAQSRDDEYFAKWNKLKAVAKKAQVTYENPLLVKIGGGNYIGIYKSKDNTTYYLYSGDMNNWKRTGKAVWITALDYSTTYSDTNVVRGQYIDEFTGSWINDKPQGAFVETNTMIIDKPSYTANITRTYSGNVYNGTFDGNITWNVNTQVSYKSSGNTYSSNNTYEAKFIQGFIQGYNADRNGKVYVSEMYGGKSQDELHQLKQYGYSGIKYFTKYRISGNSIVYDKEIDETLYER